MFQKIKYLRELFEAINYYWRTRVETAASIKNGEEWKKWLDEVIA